MSRIPEWTRAEHKRQHIPHEAPPPEVPPAPVSEEESALEHFRQIINEGAAPQ